MFEEIGLFAFIIFTVLALVMVYLGFQERYRYQLIADTPRSKIRSIAMGLVELHGRVKADKIIYTPFSKSQCVFYRYSVEEYRKHTKTDSDGKRETYYTWDTVDSGTDHVYFYAKDETGEVLVNPAGANYQVSLKTMFYENSGFWGSRSGGLRPIDPNKWSFHASSEGDRRYYEYFLEPNEDLFIMGTAAIDQRRDGESIIKKGKNEPTYIISNQGEVNVARSFQIKMSIFFAVAFVFIIIGTFALMFSFA